MSNFLKTLDRPFIALAMRRIAEHFQTGAQAWYEECGIFIPVRTASAVLLLDRAGRLGTTELAGQLRQNHPTIINWMRTLGALGFVEISSDTSDGRRSLLSLTAAGKEQASRLRNAQDTFHTAYAGLCEEVGADIYPILVQIEEACGHRSMLERLREAAQIKPAKDLIQH